MHQHHFRTQPKILSLPGIINCPSESKSRSRAPVWSNATAAARGVAHDDRGRGFSGERRFRADEHRIGQDQLVGRCLVKNSSKYLRSQGIDATLAANVLLDRTVSAAAAVYRP